MQCYDTALLDPVRNRGLQQLKLRVKPIDFEYDVQELCSQFMDGTRGWLFDLFDEWMHGPEQMLIIEGGPGVGEYEGCLQITFDHHLSILDHPAGKSCWAAQLAVSQGDTIKAAYFCRHDDERRKSAAAMIRTLAFQLATVVPRLWKAVLAAAETEAGGEMQQDLHKLFDALLLHPLQSLDKAEVTESPLIAMIDALDEAEGQGGSRNEVLDLLCDQLTRLPKWIRFVVTCRSMARGGTDFHARLVRHFNPKIIYEDDRRHKEDLRKVIRARLLNGPLLAEGEDIEAAVALVEDHSRGSFAYVAQTFAEVVEPAARAKPLLLEQLQVVDFLPEGVDGLYMTAFRKRIVGPRRQLIMRLIQALTVVREAPTAADLQAMVMDAPGSDSLTTVEHEVRQFAPFFRFQGPPGRERIYPFHKTVNDFFLDPERSRTHAVDPREAHRLTADSLRRYIESRIGAVPLVGPIRSTLACDYAVRHAAAHALVAGDAQILDSLVYSLRFLKVQAESRRLYDLTGELVQSPKLGGDLLRWLRLSPKLDMMERPLTVALGALNSPTGLRIEAEAIRQIGGKVYAEHLQSGLVGDFVGRSIRKPTDFSAQTSTLLGHTGDVASITFSTNAALLATSDTMIYIWDAITGRQLKRIGGVNARVISSVSFHPNQQLIAGGERGSVGEKTLHIFDIESGQVVCSFEASYVTCCAFSPKTGDILVSGEWFGGDDIGSELRVWDTTGRKLLLKLTGHKDVVTGMQFNPEGTKLLTCSWDRTAIIWDPYKGQQLQRFEGVHTAWGMACAWSQDESVVATSALDGLVVRPVLSNYDEKHRGLVTPGLPSFQVLWSVATGQPLRKLVDGRSSNVMGMSFSPDGSILAAAAEEDCVVSLYEVRTGRLLVNLENGHTSATNRCAFSPDGKVIASGSTADHRVVLWDVNRIQTTIEMNRVLAGGHKAPVNNCAFDTVGGLLASVSNDRVTIVWDPISGSVRQRLDGAHSGNVNALAFSPDGHLATGSDDRTIVLWDPIRGCALSSLKGAHTWPVVALSFSHDGARLLSAARDKVLALWDPATGSLLARSAPLHVGMPTAVAFGPSGLVAASVDTEGDLLLWDATNLLLQHRVSVPDTCATCLTFPGGNEGHVAVGYQDGAVRVYNAAGSLIKVFSGGHRHGISDLCTSPDSQSILSLSSDDGTIVAWALDPGVPTGRIWVGTPAKGLRWPIGKTPQLATLHSGGGTWWPSAVELHQLSGELAGLDSDPRPLATEDPSPASELLSQFADSPWTDGQHTLRGWILRQHTSDTLGCEFSPDSSLLATCGSDKTVVVWDVAARLPRQIFRGHEANVHGVCFHPAGNLVASGSWDKTIILWSLTTGQQLYRLSGHKHWVMIVQFSPDGSLLVSGGHDRTAGLWDPHAGTNLAFLDTGSGTHAVCFSADSKTLLVTGGEKILVFDVESRQKRHTVEMHTNWVKGISYNAARGLFCTASDDGKVFFLSDSDFSVVLRLGAADGDESLPGPRAVKVDQKGLIAAVAGGSTVMVFDVLTGKRRLLLHGHSPAESLRWVAISPDGRCIASVSSDKNLVMWKLL